MTCRNPSITLLIAILAVSTLFAVPGLVKPASAAATPSPLSWNPKVGCTPLVVRISDITGNQTQQSSFSASPFNPGITTTVLGGQAKRWLTSGTTPAGWNPPGPACTVTNSMGTTSVFVQINGIERSSLTTEDYSTTYDATNGGTGHSLTGDTTFNIFEPSMVSDYGSSCTAPSDPTCYGRLHAEIDHDWKAAGYCGTGTVCDNATLVSQTIPASTMIDVQGFVYWDPGNLNATWHQFNGWEIHPLSAWKLSSAPPPVPFTVSVSPNSPRVGDIVSFIAAPMNGTTASSFSWDFGDGVTASGSSVSHIFITAQAFTVSIAMLDSQGNAFSTWRTVPVGSWNPSVGCAPTLTTLEGVLGNTPIQRISTDPNSVGADYSGGGFRLGGNLPFGSNPSTWPFFKRDTQMPCAVNGIPTFVELHNVTVTNRATENCATAYSLDNGGGSYPNGWQSCDVTFTLVTPGYGDDATCPGCYMHRVFAAIDRDWNASGMAPAAPQPSQRIDVQGFVFWNNDEVNASWHSFTGWELRPVSAWRATGPSVTAGFTVSPSNPTTGQITTFAGAGSGGTPPYTFAWDFGDGTVATGSSASHIYSSGAYSVHMAATDSLGIVGAASQTVTAANPYSMVAAPSSLSVAPGKTNSSNILVTSLNGFSGNVSLSAPTGPSGLTVSLTPTTVSLASNSSASSVLSISAGSSTPPGSYAVTVIGVSGSFQQSVPVSVTVTGTPTFFLSAQPSSLMILAGSKGTDNIVVSSIGGFGGSVKLTVAGAPSGVKVALNPTTLTLSPGGTAVSQLTATTSATSLAGNYTLTVTGTGGGMTRRLTLPLIITNDVTISANPTSLTIPSGSSKSSTITLKSLGLKGNIALAASVSDSSLTATLSAASLSFTPGQSKSATLTVTSKTPGTYTVTVTATSGSIVHSLTIPVAISDFSISTSPNSITVARGTTITSTISLSSLYGFAGTVKLTSAVSPTGPKATLSNTSAALTSGQTKTITLTITSTTTTPTGTYTVTVTGTSGGIVHKTTITFTLTA